MKNKISYKILSVVLAVIMIISSVNISSFAATAETASPTNANDPTTTSTEVTTETSTESTNVDDENYIIFDHLFSDVDTSLITTNQLFVTTSDSSIFTKNTNVVSNYDEAYIIECESVKEAQYVYSYYIDKVDFISDLSNQIELSDNETTEQSEDDVADMSEVNENSDDAIANLNTAVEEMEQTIEEDKELDEKTGYEGYIALIDSGVELTEKDDIDAPEVSVSLVDEEPEKDSIKSKHGTLMYKYIKEENPDAKVISIKAFDGKTTNAANIYAAIQYAIEAKVSVINLSFAGPDVETNASIKDIIQTAIDNKITVIGAAGNYNYTAKDYIPGCIDDAIVIGAANEDGTKQESSNYDADLYVISNSTSEATARYSGIYTSGKDSNKVFTKLVDTSTETDATSTDAQEDIDINSPKLHISTYYTSSSSVKTIDDLMFNNMDSIYNVNGKTIELTEKEGDDEYLYGDISEFQSRYSIIDYAATLNNSYGLTLKNVEIDIENNVVKIPKCIYNKITIDDVYRRLEPDKEITNDDITVRDTSIPARLELLFYPNNSIIPVEIIDNDNDSTNSFQYDIDYIDDVINISNDYFSEDTIDVNTPHITNIKVLINDTEIDDYEFDTDENCLMIKPENIYNVNKVSIVIDSSFELNLSWREFRRDYSMKKYAFTLEKTLYGVFTNNKTFKTAGAYFGSEYNENNNYTRLVNSEQNYISTDGPIDFACHLAGGDSNITYNGKNIFSGNYDTTNVKELSVTGSNPKFFINNFSPFSGQTSIGSYPSGRTYSNNDFTKYAWMGTVLLACSHGELSGSMSSPVTDDKFRVKVERPSKSDNYVYLVIQSPEIFGQSAYGKIKVNFKAGIKSYVTLNKTDQNGKKLEDVIFAVYNNDDPVSANPYGQFIGVMKTSHNNDGVAKSVFSSSVLPTWAHKQTGDWWKSDNWSSNDYKLASDGSMPDIPAGTELTIVELGRCIGNGWRTDGSGTIRNYITDPDGAKHYYFHKGVVLLNRNNGKITEVTADNTVEMGIIPPDGGDMQYGSYKPSTHAAFQMYSSLEDIDSDATISNRGHDIVKDWQDDLKVYDRVVTHAIAHSTRDIADNKPVNIVNEVSAWSIFGKIDRKTGQYIRIRDEVADKGLIPKYTVQAYYNGTKMEGNSTYDSVKPVSWSNILLYEGVTQSHDNVYVEDGVCILDFTEFAKRLVAANLDPTKVTLECTETSAPFGYALNSTPFNIPFYNNNNIPLDSDGSFVWDAIPNNITKQSEDANTIYIAAKKVDSSGRPIAGVTFTFYDINDTPITNIGTAVTDANGVAVISIANIAPYQLKYYQAVETAAPANIWNYQAADGTYPNRNKVVGIKCTTYYNENNQNNYNRNYAIQTAGSYTMDNKSDIIIALTKASTKANTTGYTTSNVNYNLAGAEYKLFKYQADAIAAENDAIAGKTEFKNAIFTFTTKEYTESDGSKTYESDSYAILDKLTVNDTHNDFTTYTIDNKTYYDYMNRDSNGIHTDTTFYLVETKAPRGYKRSEIKTITVKANSEIQVFNMTDEPVDDPFSLQVNKYDSFGNKTSNITNGKVSVKYSFYEAEMYNNVLSRQEVINSGKRLDAYSGTASTNENGVIEIHNINFPRGYVVIDEITYPSDFDGKRAVYITKADGTKLDITNDMYFVTDVDFSDTRYERVTYYPNGATTYAQLTGDTGIAFKGGSNVADVTVEMYNNAVRGNIELNKINELTGEPMEGVKFSITNVKTHEKHYIFTNAEGKATTKIAYDPNKSFNDNYGPHCNYYDDVVDDDGNIVSKDYDPSITDATVWFGYDVDNNWVSPDDWKLDSFPDALWGSTDGDSTIGTYIIKEERCAANTNVEVDGKTYKFQLIPTIDTHIFAEHDLNNVYDKNATESDGKIYNTKLPEIRTQARVLNTSQPDSTDESGTTVKDLSQTLANQSTDLIIPETNTDTTKTDDNNTDSDPVEPTEPVDPVDPTVEDDVIVDYTDQTIEDEVFYEKLRAGTKYDVLSKLMLVTEELDETGKPITEQVVDEEGNPVLDENGEPIFKDKITVEQYKYKDGSDAIQMTSFITGDDYKKSLYEKTGSHVITFEHIDVTGIDEKHQHFVLFEQIYLDDNYSSLEDLQEAINNNTYKTRYDEFTEKDDMDFFPLIHEDAYDETQSVYPTVVHTTALNNPTVDHIAHNTKTTITDRVYYRGLTIGKEYTITGSLVVKEGTNFTNIKYDPKNPDADADGFVTTTTNTDDTDTNDNSSKAYFLRDADGNVVTATHTFVATVRDGYIDLDFEVDLSDVAGKSTVAFEELKYGNIIIGTHMDLEDEDQTIHVPEIGTLTYNSEIDAEKVCTEHDLDISKDTFEKLKEIYTDDELALAKQIKADKGKSFTDVIHYKNLLANRKYEITGVLKDKATGEIMKDASGKDITATMTYTTPEVSEVVIDKSPLAVNYVLEDGTVLDLSGDHADYLCEGNIFLKFEGYDFTNLGNKTGVVFETIKLINENSEEPENPDEPDTDNTNNLIVATHEDINDVTQFIYFAEVGTEANDDITEKPITPYQQQTYINDRVSYKNVIPGKPYTLTATIHVKNDSTGKYKDGDVLLENGKPVTVTHTFTPTTTDGEEIVQIPVNTINLEGMKLVVFENMENQYHIEVAAHDDLEDDKQTVPVPKARTSASITDFSDMEKITLVDTIKYEKFLVGETYVAKGYLVDENGEKVKIDGEYVTAEQEFVAEKEDDTVDVKFTFNAADLSGKFVVFEEVYIKTTDKETNSPKEVLVAEHKDIKDNNQTVTINMEMKIQIAKGDKDKTNYFLKGAEITVYTTDGKIAKDVDGKDCVGISDENGLVSFNVPYGEYYAMETKAPNGYNISTEKYTIKPTIKGRDDVAIDTIKVTILDTAIVIPPKTGDILLWIFLAIFIISIAGLVLSRKKKLI